MKNDKKIGDYILIYKRYHDFYMPFSIEKIININTTSSYTTNLIHHIMFNILNNEERYREIRSWNQVGRFTKIDKIDRKTVDFIKLLYYK